MEGITITLNTLPTWAVGLVMLYTAFIWLLTSRSEIRMDSKVVAYTLISWGSLYLLSIFAPDRGSENSLITRVFMSRVVICFICLSQALPMTVSYFRGKKRKGVTGG